MCSSNTEPGGMAYLVANPDIDQYDERFVDCYGSAENGVTGCTCWVAVYSSEQFAAQPCGLDRIDLPPRRTRCADCAFRRDSPERSDPYQEDQLLALAFAGEPFFCHDGMRRPLIWRHPTLGDVPGDPADWHPLIVDAIPYRADGQPAFMCAGWTVERRKATADA